MTANGFKTYNQFDNGPILSYIANYRLFRLKYNKVQPINKKRV